MSENAEYAAMGRRIELRRKELGLTLADIALDVGVAASTIQRYEKGRFEKIKMPVIEAIASALHVSPDWVIGETDDPTDYEDGDVLADIPLSYVEAADGDMRRARAIQLAAEEDAQKENALTFRGERSEATDDDLKAAFWGGEKDLSPEELDEMWEDVKEYARYKVEQQRRKKKSE